MEHAYAAARIAELLSADYVPVALTFVDEPPGGVAVSSEVVPSILAVLPGGKVEEFVAALEVTATANAGMKEFYETAKANFT
jgi:hypothetical protein